MIFRFGFWFDFLFVKGFVDLSSLTGMSYLYSQVLLVICVSSAFILWFLFGLLFYIYELFFFVEYLPKTNIIGWVCDTENSTHCCTCSETEYTICLLYSA